jgi:outer membrane protein
MIEKMKTILHFQRILVILAFAGLTANAQNVVNPPATVNTNDSLTITTVLQTVIQSHPSIKQAEEALTMADIKIALSKAANLPEVSADANYTHIGPVPEITFGGATFQMAPSENYNAALNYHQTIYDFGKTSKSTDLEKENKNLATQNIGLLKQKLALFASSTFYNLLYLQEAILIKEEQLSTLKEHLTFIEKKKVTGSATQYELLVTKVKISNTENQKLDLQTYQKVQSTILNSLMGTPASPMIKVKRDVALSMPPLVQDSLVAYAYTHRTEVVMAKEKETIAQLQYSVTKSQNNASLSVLASAGMKDGYFPDLTAPKLNYAAGLALHIPLLDGSRQKNNLLQIKSVITNAQYETDIAKRNVTNEVVENDANCLSAKQKISQYELQLAQAQEAYNLAKVSFNVGAITNLDLLDAETSVSESKLYLLKSQIDYIVNICKLKVALGDNLY